MIAKNLKGLYQRNRKLISSKINREFIIIDPVHDKFFILNETGEFIFKFLFKKRSFFEIEKAILDKFQVVKPEVSNDISDFLDVCFNSDLIKRYVP